MPLPVVPPRARVEIVAGRLLRLNPPVSESMVPWGPKAGAWRHTLEAGWREYEPEIRVAGMEAETESAASRFLVSRWPERVRQAVRGFSHGQWRLILHANYCGPHYEELLASSAAMGWLVAYRDRFRPGEPELATWAAARRLTGLRRRTIAGELGFQESERTVRLLGRVPVELLSVETMRAVRAALGSEAAERLWPLRRVNQAVASIVARPARLALVTQRFLEAVCEWGDGAEMERCLDRLDAAAGGAHPVFDTPEELPAPVFRRFEVGRFPAPPVPDAPGIVAIRSREDLRREGEEMRHCAGSYAQRVRNGDAYFYHMSEPEKVTICLTPGLQGWVLEEARGVCNQGIRAETRAIIEGWVGHRPERARLVMAQPRLARRRRRLADPAQMSFEF